MNPEFPTWLPHLGNGHPVSSYAALEPDAPGGDAGARDQFLYGEADGAGVRFRSGQCRVSGQGGTDTWARVGDDGVEGIAPPVGHVADVGLGALRVHAMFGGVVDQLREDLHEFGTRVGSAHALGVEVLLEMRMKSLG